GKLPLRSGEPRLRGRGGGEYHASSLRPYHATKHATAPLGDWMSVSILVVDDEPGVALLFRQRFRREVRDGTYVMHFAISGEDALDKLANGIEPQLIVILSDINMPGMDGLTLLREVKRRFPDIRVMLVRA